MEKGGTRAKGGGRGMDRKLVGFFKGRKWKEKSKLSLMKFSNNSMFNFIILIKARGK